MKLRTTIAVGLVVLTIVVGGTVFATLEYNQRQAVDDVEQSVQETAALAAAQIGDDLDERADRVGFIASQPEMADLNDTGSTVEPFIDNTRFEAGQVNDANGTVIAVHGAVDESVQEELVGSDVGDEPYIQAALDGATTTSDPIEREGGYAIVAAAPIFDTDGDEVVGVLSASLPLDRLTIFSAVEPLQTQTQTVTVASGDTVLFGDTGALESSDVITGSATSDTGDLAVTVHQDRSQLDAQLRLTAIVQGASLLVILLTVAGLGLLEYRVTLSQTSALLDGFERVRGGDYDQELEAGATEEWQEITDGFNETVQELKEREAAIRDREQRLEVLNRVLRHNLSNDLTVVTGYIDMAIEQIDDEAITDQLTIALEETEGLLAMGEKARQIDKAIESTEHGRVSVDLVETVETAVTAVQADHPDVAVETSLPDEAKVMAIGRIGIAVENLCENAAVHNDAPDPQIEISVSVDGETASLTVTDNGPGIPDHEVNTLQEGEETALEHGSGLGLWVVYWLVTRSDGELHFEDGIDGGTAVTCTFERSA